MKKVLLTAFALGMSVCAAFADDQTVLDIYSANGETQRYSITDIVNITFDGDKMLVNGTNGTTEFDIDSVEQMIFATVSGVENNYDFDLGNSLEVAIKNGMLTASQPEKEINLRIFTLQGEVIFATSADSELSYSLTELPQGVYLIMVNDKVIKFIR
jgi:hypothetical protein